MLKHSAVVDTNIIISSLILPGSKPAILLDLWKHNRFTVITSDPMLKELETVLKRPKYRDRYHISLTIQCALLSYMKKKALVIPKLTKPKIKIRDVNDLIVLATALDGHTDYLITGDKDLLVLKVEKPKIITVSEFLNIFREIGC
jgi:uncharacterized protein